MKNAFSVLFILASLSLVAQSEIQSSEIPNLENEQDSLSYFLGLSLGYELQTPPFEANKELILQGFNEAFQGEAPIDPQTTRTVFQSLQMALQMKESEKANKAAAAAMEEGRLFLEENGKREGVVTTPSGLQYEVLIQGEGASPADTSEVEVHYHGTLIDGTVFDSSIDRGEPITFPLNRVIPGWTEGVQLMTVGATYNFFIPSELAYGPKAAGPIPPNSVLIFKVQLLDIK